MDFDVKYFWFDSMLNLYRMYFMALNLGIFIIQLLVWKEQVLLFSIAICISYLLLCNELPQNLVP